MVDFSRALLRLGGCTLGLLLSFSQSGLAQTSFKIGYIDPIRMIEEAPQVPRIQASLADEFRSRDDELKQRHTQIQEMEADLEKNILVMDATSAQARQREIENLKRRLVRSRQETREDVNLRRNEELAKLQTLVRDVVVELARAGNYDLIIEQAVYVNEVIDITDLVLERLAELP